MTGAGKIPQIPFTSDSRHVPWLTRGAISAQEDPSIGAVAVLLNPAGPARPARLLMESGAALELAHQLIAASARLSREGEP